MERKLVTVRQIGALNPIPNADMIEVATIDGWQCVVKKGEFAVGDLCIFFEIDSILPGVAEGWPEFEFLRKSSSKMRLRTVKLRGQISQGLALPLSLFASRSDIGPDIQTASPDDRDTDWASVFGVIKWEIPPSFLAGDAKGVFPTHIVPKTDQERIQNLAQEWSHLRMLRYQITEKMDGTSATYYYIPSLADETPHFSNIPATFGVCSRNLELKENPDSVYWKAAARHDLWHKMRVMAYSRKSLLRGIALQAELIGPAIQDNPHKLKAQELRVFGIYSVSEHCYLDPLCTEDFCGQFDLPHVPVLRFNPGKIVMPEELPRFIEIVQRHIREITPDAEGWVFKELNAANPQMPQSFKVISPEYLLKHE